MPRPHPGPGHVALSVEPEPEQVHHPAHPSPRPTPHAGPPLAPARRYITGGFMLVNGMMVDLAVITCIIQGWGLNLRLGRLVFAPGALTQFEMVTLTLTITLTLTPTLTLTLTLLHPSRAAPRGRAWMRPPA